MSRHPHCFKTKVMWLDYSLSDVVCLNTVLACNEIQVASLQFDRLGFLVILNVPPSRLVFYFCKE